MYTNGRVEIPGNGGDTWLVKQLKERSPKDGVRRDQYVS